ncbi:MAG TPA: large conductance mechanosensitive channel protein MscL [Candidatus Limnocylindrales bacterium]
MLKGFKEFITRGNVVDLAVGIVIGAAFGAMVAQLTESFLEPLIQVLTGGNEVGGKFFVNGVAFDYGAFLNSVIAFLLTALAVYFFVVVPMNRWFRRAQEEPTDEVVLLTQIRDRLPGAK